MRKQITANTLGIHDVRSLVKIDSQEAAIVKYYDNRLRKLQNRNEIWHAVFIILMVAIVVFCVTAFAHGATPKIYCDKDFTGEYVDPTTGDTYYDDLVALGVPYRCIPYPPECETDTECMEMYGGDGGPTPYDYDEVAND